LRTTFEYNIGRNIAYWQLFILVNYREMCQSMQKILAAFYDGKSYTFIVAKKWAIFSQTHLVTLRLCPNLRKSR
jgi:hypothetical protein